MPKISVIMPVYNAEKYLETSLNCIIEQTLDDIEIICIDDGSTDNSLEILNKYAQKDNRIKLVTQKNQFAGIARNKGLEIATGEYLLFLDSDDIFNKNMFEKMYNKAINSDADITLCRYQTIEETTNEIQVQDDNIIEEFLPKTNVFSATDISKKIFQTFVGWPWDKLFKREFIKNNKLEFQGLRHSNDTYFVLMALTLSTKITYINDVLVTYRIHGKSLANTKLKYPECFYYALKALKLGLEQNNIYEIYEQSFLNYCMEFGIWHSSTMNNKQAKSKVKYYLCELLLELKFFRRPISYFYNKKRYFKICKYLIFHLLFSKKI